jgi:hypothetical protein
MTAPTSRGEQRDARVVPSTHAMPALPHRADHTCAVATRSPRATTSRRGIASRRRRGVGAGVAAATFALAGCTVVRRAPDVRAGAGDAAIATWECPAGWVAAAVGGCGPAVIVCAPDGGAREHACDGLDLAIRPSLGDGDAGTTAGAFYLRADGAVGGPWPDESSASAGPSTGAWDPAVGIPRCPDGWRRPGDGPTASACDPALRTDCPAGSEALPGGGCTATSERDCPSGAWPDVAAEAGTAPVAYVRAGADATGSDGSLAHPFATITEIGRASCRERVS